LWQAAAALDGSLGPSMSPEGSPDLGRLKWALEIPQPRESYRRHTQLMVALLESLEVRYSTAQENAEGNTGLISRALGQLDAEIKAATPPPKQLRPSANAPASSEHLSLSRILCGPRA
jgi:hypothetical protein